jgi:hypothetical protein
MRFGVDRPHKWLEEDVDKRPLRLRVITATTAAKMRNSYCQFGNRLRRIKQLQ